MYKISVPVINQTLTDGNKHDFLGLLKRAKADRVFLCSTAYDSAHENPKTSKLNENIKFFKDNGFEVGIWVDCIGHGATIHGALDKGEKPKYQTLVDLNGKSHFGTRCPADENYINDFSHDLAHLVSDKDVSLIMLDDDFRLSQHGGSPCCTCEYHLKRISEICGEEVDRETLKANVSTGKPNKYRDAFIKANGESLKNYAIAMRREMDKVRPDVTIAICSAYSPWGIDGADLLEITDILAGNNKKVLRLHGAPYWSGVNRMSITAVCEMARMFASFSKDRDIDLMSEGDGFRPRPVSPAALLEIFDGALRADGAHSGILKYLVNYNSQPLTETGYVTAHAKHLEKHYKISEFFDGGANTGVRILIKPYIVNDSDFTLSTFNEQSPIPSAGYILARSGIPTIYSGKGCCAALFGESARHFDESEFEGGAIIDAVAAKILTERGIDVGLDGEGNFVGCTLTHADAVDCCGESVFRTSGRFFFCPLKEAANPTVFAKFSGERKPIGYQYENAKGQKFFVLMLDGDAMDNNSNLFRCYPLQVALKNAVKYISGAALPVETPKTPDLYCLAAKDEKSTSVALFNCFPDAVFDPVIALDKEYKSAEFVGCSGHLEGNKIILDTDIPAYEFVTVRAYNN